VTKSKTKGHPSIASIKIERDFSTKRIFYRFVKSISMKQAKALQSINDVWKLKKLKIRHIKTTKMIQLRGIFFCYIFLFYPFDL